MAKYVSDVKQVGYPQESVYNKLSNLNNFGEIKDKVNNPAYEERFNGIPADKIGDVKKYIQSMEFTADDVSVDVPGFGKLSVRIVEREPMKCVKYESVNSPVGFRLWVQMLPVTEMTSKIRVTLDADLNFFIKQMLGSKIEKAVEKIADMLALMPY
ncbi:MAG: SRPBCC family protein [Bacteroidaceae bacterium]|nr:SRPBCC family protein [Bacteroidaceae bacterium]